MNGVQIGQPPRERSAHPVYENVAALRLAFAADLAKSDVFKTLGYYVAGDGGGNEYDYDSGSAVTEDNGFFIEPIVGGGRFIAIDQKIANVLQFGAIGDDDVANGATNSTAFNAAIAAFVTLNNADPQVVDKVYVPAGHYRIDSTIVCDCTNNPNLVFDGAGRESTQIQSTNVAPDPLFDLTNAEEDGSPRMEFGKISNMTFIGTQPGGGQPVDVVRLTAINHSTLDNVRTIGGSTAGLTVGYMISSSLVDCHFGDGQKFGMRIVGTIFNQISFRRTTFINNTIAGFYNAHPGPRGLNFNGCGFETNGTLGAFFQRVLGLAIHGCYFEANGGTAAHTFTTRSGASFIGGNWAVRGDVCLSGQTTFDLDDDNLTNDTTELGCESVSMKGNAWSPDNTNQRHVILAGVAGGVIEQPADSGTDQVWVTSQNGRSLWKNLTLVGNQDHSGPHIDYAASSASMTAISPGVVDGNRFSWVSEKLLELDLGRGADTGNSTWEPMMATPGRLLWEMSDTVAGGGDYISHRQPIATISDFTGEQCVLEVYFYVMTKEDGASGNYECGLQMSSEDSEGSAKESAASAQALHPDDAATTGTVSISSTALVVASATGIQGGDPIVIEGAGAAGIDFPTVVETISGTAVTLRDAVATGVTDLEVRVPRLSKLRMIYTPGVDLTDGDTEIQFRRISGNANDKIWFDRVTVRVMGSDENMRPTRDPMQLVGVGTPESVVAGAPGYRYTDFAGTVGSIGWLKESGQGKTGWEKVNSAAAYGGISAESNAVATTISGSAADFGANAVQIVTFGINNSISLNVTPDHTNDHLLIDLAGNFQVNL